MRHIQVKSIWLGSTALVLSLGVATGAMAQTTPGDRPGTPSNAGLGQSAVSTTQAPAADDRTTRPVQGGGDIIVTARRVEERLQDVPISITVFNQQQLQNRNVVQTTDLATYTPSLSANNSFGSQNAAFAIRGFVQDIGTQPSVGIYFADVVSPRGAANNIPIGDGAGPGNFFDLQNVQVLKGPQGTLFGRNTTGGAILLVPQKPTSRLEGYVEGSYGNYNLKRVQAVANIPFNDRARFRIGIDHEERDGYLKNKSGVGPSRYDDIDYTAIRGSLVLDLTPDLENYTIVSYLKSDTHGDTGKVVGCLPTTGLNILAQAGTPLAQAACAQLARQQARGDGFYDVDISFPANARTLLNQWQIINTTTWRATDDLTIKNIVSYAELREIYRNPIFGTDFDAGDTAAAGFLGVPKGNPIDFAISTPIAGRDSAAQSTFTEEFQVQGSALSDKLTYQGGAYLELSTPLGFSGAQSPVLLNCADSDAYICANPLGGGDINYTRTQTRFRNVGLYAQSTYSLTDTLKLTGGVRYTWDRVRNFSELRTYQFAASTTQQPTIGSACNNPDLTLPACAQQIRQSSRAPTWLIDLDYKPTEDILFYAKWTRGYRAGGVVPQAPTGLTTFGPEKVDTYEGGVKTAFHGPLHATLDLDGFYNDFRNQQLQANFTDNPNDNRSVGPASGIINAGKSRIWGIEAEGSIRPFTGFTLDGSYAYINTKIRRIASFTAPADSPYVVTFPVQAGDRLLHVPKNKYSITGTYQLPLDESIGRIAFGATFTHINRQQENYGDLLPAQDVSIPGFGVVQSVPTPADIRRLSFLRHRNLLNLNLNWNSIAGSPIDLQLFATNVTNRKYYSFINSLYPAAFFETATISEPRMFGGRLRYRFGP